MEFYEKTGIDLYILIDKSQKDPKYTQEFLKSIFEFADVFLSDKTNQIGFGYFSDKPTPPFNVDKFF